MMKGVNKEKERPPSSVRKRKESVCRLCGGDGRMAHEVWSGEGWKVKLVTCICKEKR